MSEIDVWKDFLEPSYAVLVGLAYSVQDFCARGFGKTLEEDDVQTFKGPELAVGSEVWDVA